MKILICGVGAIGSNLTSLLVPDLKGEHEITILDKDKVEERNVQAGTQFYMPDQIGMSKVEALQYNLYKWFEREITIDHHELLAGDAFNYDLIVDCFDNYASRKLLQEMYDTGSWLRNEAVPYELLHIGFSDQFTFAIEWADNYKVPSDIMSGFDICTQDGAASFVKMVASLASQTVQEYIRTGQKRELVGGKLFVREIK